MKLVLVNNRATLVFLSLLYRGIPNCFLIFSRQWLQRQCDSTALRLPKAHEAPHCPNEFACNVFELYCSHLKKFFVHDFFLPGWYFFSEIVTDLVGGRIL